ncbi:hypothetical protein B4073_4216 [Bacillus subtilis]|nr:hypothetical protein B4068_4094 [Bacillus subtilis]KIN55771.1 hypothetical protein B4073_4216 [Bacillus subtilis]
MKNKYLIKKEWDKKKAIVIMKSADQADEVVRPNYDVRH